MSGMATHVKLKGFDWHFCSVAARKCVFLAQAGSTQFNGWFKLSCNWWMTLCDAYPGLDDELDAGFTGAEGWTPPDLSDLNLQLGW